MKNWEKYVQFSGFLLCSLLFMACSQEEVRPSEQAPPDVIGEEICAGVVKVKFSREVADRLTIATRSGGQMTGEFAIDSVTSSLEKVKLSRIFPYAGKFEAQQRKAGLDRWYRVEYARDADPHRIARQYARSGKVEYAGPAYRVEFPPEQAVPAGIVPSLQVKAAGKMPFNDPGLPYQWHYDKGELPAAENADIGLFQAWKVTAGSPEVIVAVMDMGIDYNHEDLKANMWVNEKELHGVSKKDDDDNGYTDDIYGYNFFYNWGEIIPGEHGTHVAGTIGAVNNNGKGVCGVAGGSGKGDGVRLMSCQIGDDGGSLRGMEAAFAYAAHNGAVIASCSWNVAGKDQALYEAIQYFVDHAGCDAEGKQIGPMKGGVVFFGAGNEGERGQITRWPAAYDNTLAIAALNEQYRRAYYSNYGTWIDYALPGGIGSKGKDQRFAVYSTIPGGYGYMSGTSMACPHASGIAALLVSAHQGPGFTNTRLKEMLEQSVAPLSDEPDAEFLGRGALRADLALWHDDGVPPQPASGLKVEQDGQLQFWLVWKIAADANDGQPRTYRVYYGSKEGQWEYEAELEVTGKAGEEMRWLIPEKKTLYLAVEGIDLWGNRSELSTTVVREWKDDQIAPDPVSAAEIHDAEGQPYLSWLQVADPHDGHAALYEIAMWRNGIAVPSFFYDARQTEPGKEIRVPLKDLEGELWEYTFAVTAIDRWGNRSVASPEIRLAKVADHELKAYPLPAHGELTLEWGRDFAGEKQLILSDLSGRVVWRYKLPDQAAPARAKIPLPGLAAGAYVLEMKASGQSQKIRILLY